MGFFWSHQYELRPIGKRTLMLSSEQINRLRAVRPKGLSASAASLAIDIDVIRQSLVVRGCDTGDVGATLAAALALLEQYLVFIAEIQLDSSREVGVVIGTKGANIKEIRNSPRTEGKSGETRVEIVGAFFLFFLLVIEYD